MALIRPAELNSTARHWIFFFFRFFMTAIKIWFYNHRFWELNACMRRMTYVPRPVCDLSRKTYKMKTHLRYHKSVKTQKEGRKKTVTFLHEITVKKTVNRCVSKTKKLINLIIIHRITKRAHKMQSKTDIVPVVHILGDENKSIFSLIK